MVTRYVQHISGQGEKWEVKKEDGYTWCVNNNRLLCHVPKSEYRLCEPPEEWEDVTMKYVYWSDLNMRVKEIVLGPHDRFRFVDYPCNGPAFIVERKKS